MEEGQQLFAALYAIEHNFAVTVATPTGALACFYQDLFGSSITSDTVHATFCVALSHSDTNRINWDIGFSDILVIDEISQLSIPIFNHVLTSINVLPVRPIVLLCGDFAQQQPLSTINGSVRQVESIKDHSFITSSCFNVTLTDQHRIQDNFLLTFLGYIWYYQPSTDYLTQLQHGRILTAGPVSQSLITDTFKSYPSHIYLTISTAASDFINTAIISSQAHRTILSTVHCTPNLLPIPLYHGLPIMLLENRMKGTGYVNGQICTVHSIQSATVLVRHPHGHIINVYPITSSTSVKPYYPFKPAYSCTVAKIQGQTLQNIILWVDTPRTPAGTCYVALSRVHHLHNILFLTELSPSQFTPVL